MGKYYINQKFSMRDRFKIFDENHKEAFFAQGKIFALGKRITLYSLDGQELLLIRGKAVSLLSKYDFYIGDEHLCTMKQEFAFLKRRYNIVTPPWGIEGNVWDLEYNIIEGNQVIARIRKKWFSWMDAYEIDVFEKDYTELLIGIVIAIDADINDADNRSFLFDLVT